MRKKEKKAQKVLCWITLSNQVSNSGKNTSDALMAGGLHKAEWKSRRVRQNIKAAYKQYYMDIRNVYGSWVYRPKTNPLVEKCKRTAHIIRHDIWSLEKKVGNSN